MRTSRSILGLVVLAGLVVPARGADTVELKWKFTKDKPFYQEMTTVTKQTMTVMGMEIKQDQTQTFYFSWTPLEEKDGTWKIRQKIEGLKMNIQIGGTPITYDSTKDSATTNPLADFFKSLVGAEFTIELDMKTMKVKNVEGRDAFLKKLSSTSQPMDALLKSILSNDALKQMADPTFAAAPDKPVKKGDTWKRTSVLDMGPVGKYDSTYTYTYDGQDEKNKDLAKIKIDTTLRYTPPVAGSNSGSLPFQITSADLKSKEATGHAEFDIAKGRLASMELKLVLDGTLNIDISGSKSEVKLNQDQKTTVKTFDENPIAPKTTEKKTEEKKPATTKPEEKKPEAKKPEEKKTEEKKPEEKKPEQKKTEGKK